MSVHKLAVKRKSNNDKHKEGHNAKPDTDFQHWSNSLIESLPAPLLAIKTAQKIVYLN